MKTEPKDYLTFQQLIETLTFKPFVYEEDECGRRTDETKDQIQVGAVVKVKGEFYFIGDVNEIFGLCDCCRAFELENITEIAYLWAPLSQWDPNQTPNPDPTPWPTRPARSTPPSTDS